MASPLFDLIDYVPLAAGALRLDQPFTVFADTEEKTTSVQFADGTNPTEEELLQKANEIAASVAKAERARDNIYAALVSELGNNIIEKRVADLPTARKIDLFVFERTVAAVTLSPAGVITALPTKESITIPTLIKIEHVGNGRLIGHDNGPEYNEFILAGEK